MGQFSTLLDTLKNTPDSHDDMIMATVVKVEGSAYRRPGGRMLVLPFGQSVGTISGGCLEGEVCKKANWLTRNGQPALQRYSTGNIEFLSEGHLTSLDESDQLADEDEALSFGLGCNGKVTVLFERVNSTATRRLIQLLQQVERLQRASVVATVIAVSGNSGFSIGDRLLLDPASREMQWMTNFQQPAQHNELAQQISHDLLFTLTRQKSLHQHYTSALGTLEVFFEYVAAPERLVIFGAGHDAQPLVSMAKMQGWYVTVIDSRAHFARPQRFPEVDQVLCIGLNENYNLSDITNGAAVAVMSHSLTQDRHWLKQLLLKPPRYIGQLGPRYRTERLISEISQQVADQAVLESGLEVLHYPIGLDIGGNTPESIALSIMAEITAVLNQRNGKMLKQREISIHAE